jgi:hypothetical protein
VARPIALNPDRYEKPIACQCLLDPGEASGWVSEWCGFLIDGELVSGTSKAGTYELLSDRSQILPRLLIRLKGAMVSM